MNKKTFPDRRLDPSPCNRRQGIKTLAKASALFTVPLVVKSRVLGRDGQVAPSERITLGGIGIRRRGTTVLKEMLAQPDVQFVAIADVRADSRQAVKELADSTYQNSDCVMFRHHEELLGRSDIDAVVIATGDRWHAPMSIYAAEAGKDVYSEKPCAITISLAQLLADTMRRCGRVFQAGTQRRTIRNFTSAIEMARDGKLGKLHTLHASIYELIDRHDWLPAEPIPAPDWIDWDRWLGPPLGDRSIRSTWMAAGADSTISIQARNCSTGVPIPSTSAKRRTVPTRKLRLNTNRDSMFRTTT